MNVQMLRFGALNTQIAQVQNGQSVTIQATGTDRVELKDVFKPAAAAGFSGEDGVAITLPEEGCHFDFQIKDVKSGETHEAKTTPELLGLYKLFGLLEKAGVINEQVATQLIGQTIVRNGGSLVIASIPADYASVRAIIDRDYVRAKKPS